MTRFCLLLACALLTACGIRIRPAHRWIGPLTADAPQCPPTKGVLILRDGIVTFAPDEGTWVLRGTVSGKTLTATQSRPTSDHKLYRTDLRATWTDAAVQGTYTTPQCTYHLDLSAY